MNKKIICVYHANCLDGFTSAWAVNRAVRDVTFIEGRYGDTLDIEQFRDSYVIFVDFSTKRNVMLDIAEVADHVLVLDHHASAELELVDLPDNVDVEFDMERSGAMITWNHYFPNIRAPWLVETVQDRDLWQFRLQTTKVITAYMFTLEQTFEVWDKLLEDRNAAISAGLMLDKVHSQACDDIISGCTHTCVFGDHIVNITNALWQYSSEIGNRTVNDNLFSVTYFIDSEGKYKYSLRAKSEFDCSILAAKYGGGGHSNAAGFTTDKPIHK